MERIHALDAADQQLEPQLVAPTRGRGRGRGRARTRPRTCAAAPTTTHTQARVVPLEPKIVPNNEQIPMKKSKLG